MFKYSLVLAYLANIALIVSAFCGGDLNAVPGCGNSCVTCDNYALDTIPRCIGDDICYEGKCICKEGYVKDLSINRCVRPEECYADKIEEPVIIPPPILPIYDCRFDGSLSRFRETVIEFTSNTLSALTQIYPETTVNSSPSASLYILSILGLYSYGESLNQILTALNLENKEQIRCILSRINEVLNTNTEGVIYTLNGINFFVDSKYLITEDFKRDVQQFANNGQAVNVDFSNADDAAGEINALVNQETFNQILNIASEEDFNDDTQLATVTGLVFNAQVRVRFDPDDKVVDTFYQLSGPVEAVYLHQKEVYRYGNNKKLNAQILELPYKSTYTGFIFFPNESADINCLIDKLGNYKTLDSAINSLDSVVVDLYFPQYVNETTRVDARTIALENLNISSIINPETAEFENIVEGNARISLSLGIQELEFQSNPNGGPSPGIPEDLPTVELRLNRPYVYLVMVNIDSKYIPVISGVRATAE